MSHKRPTILILAVLFSTFILYFVFGTGWYEPARLIIQGKSDVGEPLIQVRWDSGSGFNDYEKREFRPLIHPLDEQANNSLVLGGTGRRHSASLSDNVVCEEIIIDGVTLDLGAIGKQIPYSKGGLSFSEGATLSLSVRANSHIGVRFRTNNHSGIAFVSVNGNESEHDLYMSNVEAKSQQFDYWLLGVDGSFRVDMKMPRYAIHELEVSVANNVPLAVQMNSVEIHGKGQIIDIMQEQPSSPESIRSFDVLKSMRSYFDPGQFLQQVFFALLTSWLILSIFRSYLSIGSLRACFFEERRIVFWGLFFCSFVVFGIWLLAFWPGVMSVDSLKVWRAAMLPDVYLNDHPVLNVFLYKFLYHIYGDPVVVPLTQVVLMALLVAWFGFWLYCQNISKIILIFCLFCVFCSVPVGLYNLMLWKDIPFALLVVFWGCMLVKLYWQKCHGRLHWSGQQVVALFLLGVALGLVRHNGLVYFIVLPVMFVVLRLVSMKKTLVALLALFIVGVIGFTAVKSIKSVPGTDFLALQIHRYAGGKSIYNIVEDSERMMQDYVSVLDIKQTKQKWDKFHYYFQDRYAYWFLLHSGWWDLYPYKKEIAQFPWFRQKAMKIYEKSYQEPWVWLSWNPVWLLYLLPVVMVLFWWFPHSAVFGIVLLVGALPLIYLRIFNWRYYYFLYLGLLFILPLVGLDLSRKKLNLAAE